MMDGNSRSCVDMPTALYKEGIMPASGLLKKTITLRGIIGGISRTTNYNPIRAREGIIADWRGCRTMPDS